MERGLGLTLERHLHSKLTGFTLVIFLFGLVWKLAIKIGGWGEWGTVSGDQNILKLVLDYCYFHILQKCALFVTLIFYDYLFVLPLQWPLLESEEERCLFISQALSPMSYSERLSVA